MPIDAQPIAPQGFASGLIASIIPVGATTFTLTFGPYTDALGVNVATTLAGKLFPVDQVTGKRVKVVHLPSGQVILPADIPITVSGGSASVGPLPHTGQTSMTPFFYRVEWDVASSKPSPGNKTFAVTSGTTVDYDLLAVANAGDAVALPVALSVNGKTGTVVLTASDVGAQPAGSYATPTDVTTASTADRARANHTGTQAATTITGLATVATSGAYLDLSGRPSISPMLTPSGDTSGTTDSNAINASLTANGDTLLAPGQWYVGGLGMTVNNRRLRGSGPATVLNVIGGSTGLTLTGPGNVSVSDLQFVGGAYGIVVNGAYDADFRKLWFSAQTSGAVKINGDLATEQHWTDIVMRGVGGIAFDLTRTTSIYTGSIYLDRVRSVEPAAGATGGFRFSSTAGSASLNIAFMTQCVADNYSADALFINNCAQVFVAQSWFAINAASATGKAAIHITGGFQHSYEGCYTYTGRTDAGSPSVKIDGAATGINIGGGHVFDGTPTTVALGIAAAAVGGVQLGSYQTYCGGGLFDVPLAMPVAPSALPGATNTHGEETFSRMLCNNNVQLASGTLVLSYFTATKTEVISTIECQVGSAKSGGTYCGYGLYTVATNGTLTLVAKAEQATTPTLWNSGFQPVGGFDTKLGLSATYTKQAGQRYAVGALFVGTTGPQLIGNLQSNGTPQSSLAVTGTTLGPLAATKAGQSTLGTVGTTTHTAASLSGSGVMPYYVLN